MAGQRNIPDASIQWDNEAYVRGVVRHIRSMVDTGEDDVRATGFKATGFMKNFAPVLTGYMKNNIVNEEGRDAKGFFVAIYCRAFYWKFVEFGTEKQAPQPFARPAFLLALEFLRARVLKRRG